MENKNPYQEVIQRVLSTRNINFNPDLAKALGSANAGILISQFLYWNGKGDDSNWVYKTIKEIYDETSLGRREQDSAIKTCKSVGVLEVKLAGVPATRHFKINIEKIIELITTWGENEHQLIICKQKTRKDACVNVIPYID